MINLTKQEQDTLHCKLGSRGELYKLELLDKYGVRKCDLDMIDGNISMDSNLDIQKAGTVKFRLPQKTRKIEVVNPNSNVALMSPLSKIFEIGIETNGTIYTVEVNKQVEIVSNIIKVDDDGILFTENVDTESLEYNLIDKDGYTWDVGVEQDGIIYSSLTDNERKLYYQNELIEINFLNDKVKAYMGVNIGNALKWWSLGVFLLVKPVIRKKICTCQIYDETIILQQGQILTPKLFLKGTNYVEVLSYLLVSSSRVKINIEPTTLTLTTDLVLDDSKNRLEWFNYIAEQINYTKLSVDNEGWFISKKYVEPSPLNVGYIYKQDDMSIIIGDIDSTIDYWKVANVFKRTVSNPDVGELVSIYKNENPTNKFSTVSREFEIVDNKTVDNIANQLELDNLTRKAAFKANQIENEVVFNTLNMPHHGINDILDLRHEEAKGIFVEQSYNITFKAGASMVHTVKRLVTLE